MEEMTLYNQIQIGNPKVTIMYTKFKIVKKIFKIEKHKKNIKRKIKASIPLVDANKKEKYSRRLAELYTVTN